MLHDLVGVASHTSRVTVVVARPKIQGNRMGTPSREPQDLAGIYWDNMNLGRYIPFIFLQSCYILRVPSSSQAPKITFYGPRQGDSRNHGL